MATRFRALAAPIDASTGDQRRFAAGGLTTQPLPMPGRWVREDVGAHDNAVSVASGTEVEIDGSQVWVSGYWFDDADRETMPRLAEDVAEAMYLARQGVIGISVDLDDFEAIPVRAGTDEPVDMDDLEDPDVKMELLITKGRIRSFTFVAIPAYVETNHTIEFFDDAGTEDDEAEGEPDDPADSDPELAAALVASVSVDLLPGSAFRPPVEITGPTPMTYDFSVDPPVAYGHFALWNTCHEGFSESCVLAPRAPGGSYREFHQHRVETDQGTVYAGRITAGGNHPSSLDFSITAHAVRRHHDEMVTVANVVASEDEWGIFGCGPINRDLDETTIAIMSRRKVSPDWRETADGLSMIEVLALKPGPRATSEPGFPIRFAYHAGRQVALTAALSPMPELTGTTSLSPVEVFRSTAARLVREELDKAQAAGVARASIAAAFRGELEAMMLADTMQRMRDNLARSIGA